MAGDLFTITDDIRNIGESAINSLIHQLGKTCNAVYESTTRSQCTNCYFDVANQRSTGKYNGTGPRAFTNGKCPVCRGTGFLPGTETRTDTLQLLVDWQPKSWSMIETMLISQGVTSTSKISPTSGLITVKGFIADMPKVIQARYIIIDAPNAEFENNRFALWGEPVVQGNIIKNKYFNCFLQRFGG